MMVYKVKKIAKYASVKLASMTSMVALLVGSGYDFTLKEGSSGNDYMNGGQYSDSFQSSAGADRINGDGGDFNKVYYDNSPEGVEIDLNGNVGKGGFAKGDTLKNIQVLFGSEFSDILTGDDGSNEIFGNDGDDVINGNGDGDRLFGGKGADVISGNDGADRILGGDGDDRIFGGNGNDTLYGEGGADFIDGGDGIDVVSFYYSQAGVQVNLLTGMGSGGDAQGDVYMNIENVVGTRFDDVLTGDNAANIIDGGAGGADILNGMGGNDVISSRGDGVTVDAGDGDDVIRVGANATISGGNGVDEVDYTGHRDYQFEVLKADNKIVLNVQTQYFGVGADKFKHTFDSVEEYNIKLIGHEVKTVDIKTIWSELSAANQTDFGDVEANFLTWLGNDAGYNYDGL